MALSASIELISSSARVTSVKSHKPLSRSERHPDPKIRPQVYLGPIKISLEVLVFKVPTFSRMIKSTQNNVDLNADFCLIDILVLLLSRVYLLLVYLISV